jgi:hypothetical protein
MNSSMWFLAVTCLAYGGLDYYRVPPAPPAGAPSGIVQTQSSGYQDPNMSGAVPNGPIADGSHVGGCACEEHAGLFARLLSRLRGLFTHSSCGACANAGAAGCPTCNRSYACTTCSKCGQHAPSWGERLASLFHHSRPAAPCCEPQQGMIAKMIPDAAPLASPYTPIPTPAAPVASVIQPVSVAPARPAAPPATEISKRYLDKVANADDYSWVTGQLFYIHVHADQRLWVVRYAPVDKEDRYGGSVVLAPAAPMDGLREGDLVNVHGEILNEGRGCRYLGGPLYRALEVGLRERGQR